MSCLSAAKEAAVQSHSEILSAFGPVFGRTTLVSFQTACRASALQAHTSLNEAPWSCAIERGALELRAVERGALELRLTERGALELRIVERRALELRAVERRAWSCAPFERGALELRSSSEAPWSLAPSSDALELRCHRS